MTVIAISVGGLVVVAGGTWLIVRIDRNQRRRIQRQREAWESDGSLGPWQGPGCATCNSGG